MKEIFECIAAQAVAMLVVVLGLPFGLLLLAARPGWVDRAARALDQRRTAATLWGAGITLVMLLTGIALAKTPPARGAAWIVLAALVTLFTTGFSVGASVQGRALLRRDGGASCMVAGWFARAGVIALPVAGVAFGAYFVALSVGTPFVVWLARPRASAEPKSTTELSAGSTAEN